MVEYDMDNLKELSNEQLRELYKKHKHQESIFDSQQHAAKIAINAFYGATGNKYFRLFDPALAGAVTANGQLVIKWVRKRVNEYFNKLLKTKDVAYVVYIDTDAVNLCVDKFVDKFKPNATPEEVKNFLLRCISGFEKVINDAFLELQVMLNCRTNAMEMKCEAISPGAIWLKKKRYFMPIMYAEGNHYDPWVMKVKGLECNRSSTPMICRGKIKEALDIFLSKGEDELKIFVSDFKEEFYKLPLTEIACPRGISNIEKYLSVDDRGYHITKRPMNANGKFTGVPENATAAINFNRQLMITGLDKQTQPIRSGDKIRFVKLRHGNPTGYNVIAFRDELPPEFKLDSWVDKDTLFEVNFLKAIDTIVCAVKWNSACLTDTITLF